MGARLAATASVSLSSPDGVEPASSRANCSRKAAWIETRAPKRKRSRSSVRSLGDMAAILALATRASRASRFRRKADLQQRQPFVEVARLDRPDARVDQPGQPRR